MAADACASLPLWPLKRDDEVVVVVFDVMCVLHGIGELEGSVEHAVLVQRHLGRADGAP